jgi:hypothetical protein
MATLRERLEKNMRRDASGQLVGGTQSLAQMSNQMGLAAPPTTPGGAQAIGANPDQAKMAGTPSQKTAALRQSADQVTTLQERAAQTQQVAPVAESLRSRVESAQKTLGDTQSKVQTLIQNQVAKVNTQPPAPTLQPGTIAAGTGKSQADVDAAFSAAASLLSQGKPVTDPAVQAEITKLFELTNMDATELTERVMQSANPTGQQIGQAADAAIGSTITMDQLYGELGTTPEELSQLLGVPIAELNTYTPDQLAMAVQNLSDASEQALATTQSTLVGAAERQAARGQVEELSRSGQLGLEEELNELGTALESADVIQFGGKSWTVAELLADGNISNLISNYLLNPESDESKKLAQDPAAKPLIDFANRYKQTLTEAAKSIGGAISESERQLGENTKLQTVANVQLPNELMTALYGEGWNKRGGAALTPRGIVAGLQSLAPDLQSRAATAVAETVRKYPNVTSQLANLSPEQVQALFSGNQDKWNSYVKSLDYQNRLTGVDTIDDLAQFFGVGTEDLEAQLRQANELEKMGVPGGSTTLQFLDRNKDGKLDDVTEIMSRITQSAPVLSLEQILSGQAPTEEDQLKGFDPTKQRDPISFANLRASPSSQDALFLDALRSAGITQLSEFRSKGESLDWAVLDQALKNPAMRPHAEEAVRKKTMAETNRVLGLMVPGNPEASLQRLQEAVSVINRDGTASRFNMNQINATIAQLQIDANKRANAPTATAIKAQNITPAPSPSRTGGGGTAADQLALAVNAQLSAVRPKEPTAVEAAQLRNAGYRFDPRNRKWVK